MKTVFATSALLAATTFGSSAAAQSAVVPFDTQLLQIALQCETATTIDQCQSLVAQQLALLEADASLDVTAYLAAVTRVIDSATQALIRSSASGTSIAQQLGAIVQSASNAISVVSAVNPAASNSTIALLTVSVLEVTVSKNLVSNPTSGGLIGSALTQLASVSTNPTQAGAILSISSTVSSGGSLSEIVNVIEQVSSYASPA